MNNVKSLEMDQGWIKTTLKTKFARKTVEELQIELIRKCKNKKDEKNTGK